MIAAIRSRTDRPFQVNVFCHRPAIADAAREAAWLERLRPEFARFDAAPPMRLTEVYQSFLTDDAKLAVLLAERPQWSASILGCLLLNGSQPFARPALCCSPRRRIWPKQRRRLRRASTPWSRKVTRQGGTAVCSTPRAGRPIRDDCPDAAAGKATRHSRDRGRRDHGRRGIAAVLTLGAVAAQLGTAFVACPESSADAGYRTALLSPAAEHTVMMAAISGRPARCLANRFTALGANVEPVAIPDYPIAYDAGKSLHAAAKAKGEFGYGARWAGEGVAVGTGGYRLRNWWFDCVTSWNRRTQNEGGGQRRPPAHVRIRPRGRSIGQTSQMDRRRMTDADYE